MDYRTTRKSIGISSNSPIIQKSSNSFILKGKVCQTIDLYSNVRLVSIDSISVSKNISFVGMEGKSIFTGTCLTNNKKNRDKEKSPS